MVTLLGYAARFPVTHGYVTRLRSSVPGYAWFRYSVTHGYVSRLRSPVPGYAWFRYSVTQPGSRLRMVTLLGYAARFPVTYGYVSRLSSPVPGTHGYVSPLRSPVPGYAWLRNSVTQPGSRLRMVT